MSNVEEKLKRRGNTNKTGLNDEILGDLNTHLPQRDNPALRVTVRSEDRRRESAKRWESVCVASLVIS